MCDFWFAKSLRKSKAKNQKSAKIKEYLLLVPLVSFVLYFSFPQVALASTLREEPLEAEVEALEMAKESQKEEKEEDVQLTYASSIKGNALVNPQTPETQEPERPAKPVIKSRKLARSFVPKKAQKGEMRTVLTTAYSSTVDQCGSNPFVTASGTQVHDGTIAINTLPFGTKVKFPEVYGDKVFTVEDRMASSHKADIWFPSREQAKQFGAKHLKMEVVDVPGAK